MHQHHTHRDTQTWVILRIPFQLCANSSTYGAHNLVNLWRGKERDELHVCITKGPHSLFLCPYSMAFPHRLLLIALFPQTHFQFFLNVSNCAPRPLNCLLKAGGGMGILGRQFITISCVLEHVSSERAGRVFFDECSSLKWQQCSEPKKCHFTSVKQNTCLQRTDLCCFPVDRLFTPKRKPLGSPR